MPPQQSRPDSARTLASFKKEVAALKQQVAKLTKAVEKLQRPQSVQATKLVVNTLEIQNKKDVVVASIDAKGNLFCRSVMAASTKEGRDELNSGTVSSLGLQLIEESEETPALNAFAKSGSAKIELRDLRSKGGLDLATKGGFLIGYDKNTGTASVILSNNTTGGRLAVQSTRKSSKACVIVDISHFNGGGRIKVSNTTGTSVANLP